MKLIDAEVTITARYFYDFLPEELTVEEYLNRSTKEGCPDAVEAIPVAWVEEYIKKLQESFVSLTGWPAIETMVKKWKEE